MHLLTLTLIPFPIHRCIIRHRIPTPHLRFLRFHHTKANTRIR
jgi:hypothetical protein